MTDRPLIDEVREALEYLLAVVHGEMCAEPLERCRNCVDERDLLARLDGMTIVPAGEVERLDAFVESIGLSCCPHTQPASLREHVENEGWCVICREYVAHTDDTFRPVPWPCPTVRLSDEVERLREIEQLSRATVDSRVNPSDWLLVDRAALVALHAALGEEAGR